MGCGCRFIVRHSVWSSYKFEVARKWPETDAYLNAAILWATSAHFQPLRPLKKIVVDLSNTVSPNRQLNFL
jgi:hypothetical protein